MSRDAVYDLIKASSGFPLAFAPQPVNYCAPSDPGLAASPKCPAGTLPKRSYFVDGGVFDNGPLTIGYGLALAGPNPVPLDSLYMFFVTPSRCRASHPGCAFVGARRQSKASGQQPLIKDDTAGERQSDGLDAVAKMLSGAIPAARQYELQIAARVLPVIQLADSASGAAKAARDRISRDADRQYDRYVQTWLAARTDIASIQLQNDSLRTALTHCQDGGECQPSPNPSYGPLFTPRLRTDWLGNPVAREGIGPLDTLERLLNREPYSKLLFVTDRWHPLAGDWLFGFGGFLGEPLREYDFYVGIYDALALIASRVMRADGAHFADSLKKLVTDPPISMSSTARVVLRALYNTEFTGGSGIPLSPDGSRSEPSLSDSLLLAVVNAMHVMSDSLPPTKKCQGGPIERMECSEGLDVAFAALRATPNLGRALRAASDDCEKLTGSKDQCSDDERFEDFVSDPYSALNRLTGEVLERLLDATPEKSPLKIPLTVASATYFATNERARTGQDQGSVSLPPSFGHFGRKMMWLIPSSIGGYGGLPGYYYEWTARHHLSPDVAAGFVTRVVWASGLTAPTSPQGRHIVPAIRLEQKYGGARALLIGTFGFELGYWADWHDGGFKPTTVERKAWSWAVTSSLFAQKIRLSVGYRPTKYVTRTHSTSRALVSIGIGDVNGITYWLGRVIRQKFASRNSNN